MDLIFSFLLLLAIFCFPLILTDFFDGEIKNLLKVGGSIVAGGVIFIYCLYAFTTPKITTTYSIVDKYNHAFFNQPMLMKKVEKEYPFTLFKDNTDITFYGDREMMDSYLTSKLE